jgi:hypothetical protein
MSMKQGYENDSFLGLAGAIVKGGIEIETPLAKDRHFSTGEMLVMVGWVKERAFTSGATLNWGRTVIDKLLVFFSRHFVILLTLWKTLAGHMMREISQQQAGGPHFSCRIRYGKGWDWTEDGF